MDINSLEFKALKKTVGFCAITSIIVLLISFVLSFFSIKAIVWSFLILLFVFGFYMMYSVNLNTLQMTENVKDKKNESTL